MRVRLRITYLVGLAVLASSTSAAQTLLSNADGGFETAYLPREDVLLPPDYGAFAERYSGAWQVVGVTLEFTQIGIWGSSLHDLFVWQDDGSGAPGQVICTRRIELEPQPPYWPNCLHYEYSLTPGCCVSGDWWVGAWLVYPGVPTYYLCSDLTGGAGTTSMIKIPPGLEWPEGWQDVDLVFGPTHALGIGALVEECAPTPVESRTWGRVKSLYGRR
ncbi:MAG: hypothetical protein IT349_11775 [Candidatus Eisenbacteria bacterium]|nr:hypothetical protein [Candidatus Eisenbacteria bacterium]